MKIIFGVFENLDAKLLPKKYFDVDTYGAFDSGSVYFTSECQGLLYRGTKLLCGFLYRICGSKYGQSQCWRISNGVVVPTRFSCFILSTLGDTVIEKI